MNDIEYILRIILKARDEMAGVLSKARTQLRGFAKDADTMNVSVTNLNQAMKNFNGHMDGVTKKLEGWRAILKDAADSTGKSTKSIDGLTKATEQNVRTSQKAVQTQKQLQDRARALRDEMRAITKAHDEGIISTKTATAEYGRFGKEFDKLVLKMSDAARQRTPAHLWADEASNAAEDIKAVNDKIVADARQRAAQEKAALDDISKAVNDHVKKREAAEKATTDINKAEAADRM